MTATGLLCENSGPECAAGGVDRPVVRRARGAVGGSPPPLAFGMGSPISLRYRAQCIDLEHLPASPHPDDLLLPHLRGTQDSHQQVDQSQGFRSRAFPRGDVPPRVIDCVCGLDPVWRTHCLCRLGRRWLSDRTQFVLDGCRVIERGVQAPTIVEDFDEVEDRQSRTRSRRQRFAVDELQFQRCEPAFGYCVVPALSRTRQALSDLVARQQLLEVGRGVLGDPRSLWKISPGAGLRAAVAMRSAS
jgi:hypothetical protein